MDAASDPVNAVRKGDGMIHYCCDRCKRQLNPDDDLRYVVKMEVHAAMADAEDADVDRDHLLEVHEILERLEDVESEVIADDIYQRLRFDMCADCYRKFVLNPIGADAAAAGLRFSQN